MDIPKPVDLGALTNLLAKSKQVMNVVESRVPEKKTQKGKDFDPRDTYNQSMFSEPIYNENDEREPVYENHIPTQTSSTFNVQDYTPEQVMASNLPQVVKEAMLNKPIPRLSGPPSKVSVEEIARITGAKIRTPESRTSQSRQIISESNNSDMITISRSQLQDMINESINTFFKQTYNKTLTEETIKKTINLLIKEGKITTKKNN